MNRRRIIWYSGLVLLASGLLGWQWWTEPRVGGERLGTWLGRINDPDPTMRGQAADALGKLGHTSDKAWNELATMSLYEADENARGEAVKALKALCQSNTPNDPKRIERKRRVLQALLDGFKVGDVEVRRRVPEVVYEATGLEYHERALRRATDDTVDQEMRPAAVAALVRALKDPDEEVRDEAIRYLGVLTEVPAQAEPDLLEALRSKDAMTRDGAAVALSKVQRLSDAAIPALTVAAQDESPGVRRGAFDCLVRIGPRAVPEIRRALAKSPEKKRGYLEICLKALDGAKDG
jgi:HEAT repeat protein